MQPASSSPRLPLPIDRGQGRNERQIRQAEGATHYPPNLLRRTISKVVIIASGWRPLVWSWKRCDGASRKVPLKRTGPPQFGFWRSGVGAPFGRLKPLSVLACRRDRSIIFLCPGSRLFFPPVVNISHFPRLSWAPANRPWQTLLTACEYCLISSWCICLNCKSVETTRFCDSPRRAIATSHTCARETGGSVALGDPERGKTRCAGGGGGHESQMPQQHLVQVVREDEPGRATPTHTAWRLLRPRYYMRPASEDRAREHACAALFLSFSTGDMYESAERRVVRSSLPSSRSPSPAAKKDGARTWAPAWSARAPREGPRGKGTVVSMAMGRESTIVKRRGKKKKRGLAQQCHGTRLSTGGLSAVWD
jgi:hypothetical protein